MRFELRSIGTTVQLLLKIVFIFLFIFPLLWMISTSLQTLQETQAYPPTLIPSVPQWSNFASVMEGRSFSIYARNSVVVTLSIIVLQFLIMIPAAYAFAKYKFAGKNAMFGVVLLAFMIPSQITFIPVYLMLGDWNLIDTLLPQIIPFMSNAFGIFLLRQYFMQLPEDLIEAARLDGANEFKIIWRIMAPMAVPALATIALFSFVAHWNDYFWPLVMTNSDSVRPLTIWISTLRDDEGIANWNLIMSANVVLVVPILVVYVFCSKQILNAFVYSGIK